VPDDTYSNKHRVAISRQEEEEEGEERRRRKKKKKRSLSLQTSVFHFFKPSSETCASLNAM